jgi:hypothetical protein
MCTRHVHRYLCGACLIRALPPPIVSGRVRGRRLCKQQPQQQQQQQLGWPSAAPDSPVSGAVRALRGVDARQRRVPPCTTPATERQRVAARRRRQLPVGCSPGQDGFGSPGRPRGRHRGKERPATQQSAVPSPAAARLPVVAQLVVVVVAAVAVALTVISRSYDQRDEARLAIVVAVLHRHR